MTGVLESRTTFAAGEISPQLHARIDLAKRQTAVQRVENLCVMIEGGLTRTPGTRFVDPVRDETRPALLLPFRFSKTDAFMLVLNGGKVRFYRNGGLVETSPGVPYEIDHPYADADLPNLRWQQVTDTLFIVCDGQPPRRLKRLGNTNWQLDLYIADKPALELQNLDTTRTLTVSGVSGNVTVTASFNLFAAGHVNTVWRIDESSIAYIPLWQTGESISPLEQRRWQGNTYANDGALATTAGNPPTHTEGAVLSGQNDVAWRFLHPGYGYVRINSITSPTQAAGTVLSRIPDSVGVHQTYRWFEPAWSGERGWPRQIAYLDRRLIFARKDTLWATRSEDFYNFEIDSSDASGFAARLSPPDGQLPDIEWMLASGIIVAGAAGSEWIIRGPSAYDTLKIDTLRAICDQNEGSAPHRPCPVDGGAIYIGNTRQDLFFAQFDRVTERLTIDLVNKFARHILSGRARGLSYQRSPHRLVWVDCEDGKLVAVTFRPADQVIAFHRHPMPGAFVEQAGVVPGQEASDDEVWLLVRRVVNGQSRRYLERLQPFFTPRDPDNPTAEDAWLVDCALPFGTVKAITSLSRANPAVVTIAGHGYANGDVLTCRSNSGPAGQRLAGPYIVRNATTNTFNLEQNGALLDTSGWADFFDFAGTCAKQVSTLSGLAHLEGREVAILADGAVQGRRVVQSGAITLERPAGAGVVGLPKRWHVRLLPIEITGPRGITKGELKQAQRILLDVVHAAGGRLRVNGGQWEPLMPTGGSPLGVPVALRSGLIVVTPPCPSDRELVIEIEGDDPLPFTLTGVTADLSHHKG